METRRSSVILLLMVDILSNQQGHAFVASPVLSASSYAIRPASSFAASTSWSAWHTGGEIPSLLGLTTTGQARALSSDADHSSRAAATATAVAMSADAGPLDRRGLLRGLGAGVAGIAAGCSGILAPSAAEAANSPAVQRRPASKRKRPFLCDETISYLQNPSKQSEVWLVGTAHISNSSAQLVENVVREVKPQVVMVELDAQRIGRFLQEADDETKTGAVASAPSARPAAKAQIKTGPIFGSFLTQMFDPSRSMSDRVTDFFAGVVGKTISKMYENLGEQGYSPGEEFTVAIREARRCGAKILLGDRSVKETLRRLSQALQSTDLTELGRRSEAELGVSLQGLDPTSMGTIGENTEKLKNREMMSKITEIYKEEAPELYGALIGERDKIMAVNLMTLDPKQKIVGVVGLAHVQGIETILAANGWRIQRC